MLIDKFHIFAEIKQAVWKIMPNAECFAFGSRTTGHSRSGLYDFDVMIYVDEKSNYFELTKIKDKFANRIDEFDRPIKIDIHFSNKNLSTRNGIRL